MSYDNMSSKQSQEITYFLSSKQDVKEKTDKWIFTCDCQGKKYTSQKGKGVLYKDNLRYWYCSHRQNEGRETGIKIADKWVQFQKKKLAYFEQHGLDAAWLLDRGLVDQELNITVGGGKVKKMIDPGGKFKFSNKGFSKKEDGAIYPPYCGGGEQKTRLYVVAGDSDRLKAIQDNLTCTSSFFGESANLHDCPKALKVLGQYKEIVFLFDRDKPGREARQKNIPRITGALPQVNVGWIDLPEMRDGGKDYCDFRRHYTKENFLSLPVHFQKTEAGTAETTPPLIDSIQQLLEEELPEPKWAVEGILPDGVALLTGRPKIGKSALILNLGMAIAFGGVALSHTPVEQGDVLYFALEDNKRTLKKRVEKILEKEGENKPAADRLNYCLRWPQNPYQEIEKWTKQSQNPRLVIVDTLAKIRETQGRNQQGYDFDYQTIAPFKDISAKFAICIVLLHHTRKAESIDAFEEILGTHGLSGAVDTNLVLKRMRGQADAALHITGRDIEEKELALKFEFPLWTYLGKAEEYQCTQERQKIIQVFKEAEEPLLSIKDVAHALQEKEIPCNQVTIRKMLSRMCKSGILKNISRGKYEFISWENA